MKTVKLFFGMFFFVAITLNLNAQMVQKSGLKNEGTIQQNTIFRTSNSIELRGTSDIREIKIEVTDEGCNFSFDLSGEIQHGSLKIEIFDPKGKKRGSFSTGIQTENNLVKPENQKKSNYEERIRGEIMQQNASSGVWIIKIIPTNAHGNLNFRNQQSSNIKIKNSKK